MSQPPLGFLTCYSEPVNGLTEAERVERLERVTRAIQLVRDGIAKHLQVVETMRELRKKLEQERDRLQ